VTRGYYNNDAETRRVLTEDGWLRTGDLGFLRQASLYVTGRWKDIFFINGQNYYPHDIESIACEVDGVELNKIVIVGRRDDANSREEAIAFVLHRGETADFLHVALAIRNTVNREAGIVLDKILPVKDIPRTTSGKLQRYKLLQQLMDGELEEADRLITPLLSSSGIIGGAVPRGGEEAAVLELWKEISGNPDAGPDDRFFETGGNSLKAVELSMAVLKVFQVELGPELIYQKQTAKLLAEAIRAGVKKPYTAIPVGPQLDHYPLSGAQERLYYIWKAAPSSIAYNLPVAFRLRGRIDTDKLEACIRKMILRHDAWRSVFLEEAGPQLSIREDMPFDLSCRNCHPDELDATLRSLVRPFHLLEGPLFRITLVKTGDSEQVLLADFHHSISDGISLYRCAEELMSLYCDRQPPELPVGYKDYILWEKGEGHIRPYAAQQAFWLEELKGPLPVLEMPIHSLRPPVFQTEGGKMEFHLPGKLVSGLHGVALRQRCTMHVLLLTLYKILLWKYTGQEDLIAGVPVAGRNHPDLRHLQGMFVNNLVIRSHVRGEDNFLSFLELQRARISAILANQEYPFDRLLSQLSLKRDSSRNPVFDTMFNYQNMGDPAREAGGIIMSRYSFDPGFAKFDISMDVFEQDNTLVYGIEYCTHLFERKFILDLARHFQHMTERVAEDPDRSVGELAALPDEETERYIYRWNASGADYPRAMTVHQLFEEQAGKTPDRIAIEWDGKEISYRELNERAGSVARWLADQHLGKEEIVALHMPRCSELIVAMLGIWKAGGAFLPIEMELPERRKQVILQKSGCRLVITENHLPEEIRPHEPPVPTPASLAYVIYTSGTTGEPKGVAIEHASLVNYIHWAAGQYLQGERHAFPLFTSIAFDLTLTSIFVPLVTGNRIVIYNQRQGEVLLERIIADNKVGIIKLTPSHLRLLRDGCRRSEGSRIKRLIVGGERLETQLAAAITQLLGGDVEIYNEYGPTESTVGCMIHRYRSEEKRIGVPIGIPIANTRIYLLDGQHRPVPEGVKGELYIAGRGLARGYLHDEGQEKFMDDPFFKGEKMYRTGDLAIRLPEGYLDYMGRCDRQVKINGYRIETGEIAGVLSGLPEIGDVEVSVRKGEEGKENLYAYYTLTDNRQEALPETWLRDYLAERIPYYMIPARFILLKKMPLNGNGKIDMDALPLPETQLREQRRPIGTWEELSVKIWEEILGREGIGVRDSFFELGGDSIKAVQIVGRMADAGVSLQVRDILTYHSIEQTCRHAHAVQGRWYHQGRAEGEKERSPIETWFFDLALKDPSFYNQSVLFRLGRRIPKALLEEAFRLLINHHDTLRMNVDVKTGRLFYNNRHAETEFSIGEGGSTADLLPLAGGFDLGSSLLLRASLLADTDAGNYLSITAHHLIMDGVSWRIFLEDLYSVSTALEKGEEPKLPRKTASLKDWQAEWRRHADTLLPEEEAYWTRVEEIRFALPVDLQTNDWRAKHLATQSGRLSPEETRLLLQAHAVYRADISTILLTALAAVLKEWTGSDHCVLEMEHHGREMEFADVSRTLGWFTSLYPLHLRCPEGTEDRRVSAIWQQVKEVPRQGIGYGAGPRKRRKGSEDCAPRTEIRFNYLGRFDTEFDNDLFQYIPSSGGIGTDPENSMTAKLEMIAMIFGGQLIVDVHYNRLAHEDGTIRTFMEGFLRHLRRLVGPTDKNDQAGEFLPSDFGAVELNEKDWKTLFG
jgi:surfactin family lipopeptide synthetase A